MSSTTSSSSGGGRSKKKKGIKAQDRKLELMLHFSRVLLPDLSKLKGGGNQYHFCTLENVLQLLVLLAVEEFSSTFLLLPFPSPFPLEMCHQQKNVTVCCCPLLISEHL